MFYYFPHPRLVGPLVILLFAQSAHCTSLIFYFSYHTVSRLEEADAEVEEGVIGVDTEEAEGVEVVEDSEIGIEIEEAEIAFSECNYC